jgi:hypothetical protein
MPRDEDAKTEDERTPKRGPRTPPAYEMLTGEEIDELRRTGKELSARMREAFSTRPVRTPRV